MNRGDDHLIRQIRNIFLNDIMNQAHVHADALQDGPLHVVGRVLHGQPDKRAFGIRIPVGGTLSMEIGQEQKPVGAHGRLGRVLV